MKVLITGGSGFLGSHVADALSDAGHRVVIFDQEPSRYLRDDQSFIQGDVLDSESVSEAMSTCEAAYHMAAIADIGTAMANPRQTININLIGTLNMLEAAREAKLKRFVFSSSIYVYSNQGSFYRTSKQACEHLVQDYQESFGLDYTILRYGSLYGPRAGKTNAVFRMLNQALTENRIDYGGTGAEIREYIHVLDAAAMSVDILDEAYANQIIHLTGRERMTTRDLLELVKEMMCGRIEVGLSDGHFAGHYTQTPYSYVPKLGRRMTRSTYIDLGLGLLDCLQSMDQNKN